MPYKVFCVHNLPTSHCPPCRRIYKTLKQAQYRKGIHQVKLPCIHGFLRKKDCRACDAAYHRVRNKINKHHDIRPKGLFYFPVEPERVPEFVFVES